jgi:transcriptional regulator with XRE-family HTH domain
MPREWGRKRPSVPEVRSPTVRRRELGALLRALRLERGFTVEQVAAELLCSPSKVSRMETGQRGATLRDIRDLCDLYGVTGEDERARLMDIAREGKQQGWWQSFGLPYTDYVGLEHAAVSIKIYRCATVPGLLQTASYTRAVHKAGIIRLPDEVIEERVNERHTRQQRLTATGPPAVEVVLDEAVLRRSIGGPSAMAEQLDRIVAVAAYPNVTVQVLPFKIGAHPALESDFTILSFDGQASNIVYVEGLSGHMYLERPSDVERYQEVFERLRTMAPTPEESVAIITKARETHATD